MNKQNILADFYNLHLESGYIEFDVSDDAKYDTKKDNVAFFVPQTIPIENYAKLPDDAEKRRVIEFLSKYEPQLAEYFATEETNKQITPIDENESIETNVSQKQDWFMSQGFLDFAREYRHTKRLVDGYITKKIFGREIQWLYKSIGRYHKGLYKIKLSTGEESQLTLKKLDYEYDLNEWQIIPCDIYSFDLYGIRVGGIIFQIHTNLLEMLENKLHVQHCAFAGGKRTTACKNIFIYNRGEKYCSKKCYNKARRSRRYSNSGF